MSAEYGEQKLWYFGDVDDEEVNLGYKSFLQIRVARNCPKFFFFLFDWWNDEDNLIFGIPQILQDVFFWFF